MTIRTYTDLCRLPTLKERYDYLRLDGEVACATFGSSRWMNQGFYTSREWKSTRHDIIFRDGGCDLGVEGYEIHSRATIHHLNPITEADIINGSYKLIDPNNLITTTHTTHNAIHYGNEHQLPREFVERTPGDHIEW